MVSVADRKCETLSAKVEFAWVAHEGAQGAVPEVRDWQAARSDIPQNQDHIYAWEVHEQSSKQKKRFIDCFKEAICKLIEQGTNIFRINMSTIQNNEHKVLIEMIKKAQKLTKVKVGVMIDLQGPVIRTCEFRDKSSVR